MNSPKTERLSRHPASSMQLSKRKPGRVLTDKDVESRTRLNGDSNKGDSANGNRPPSMQDRPDKPKQQSVLVVPSDSSLQYTNGMEADNRIHDVNDSKNPPRKSRHNPGPLPPDGNGPGRRNWRPMAGAAAASTSAAVLDTFSNRTVGSSERSSTGYHAESRKRMRRQNGRLPRSHGNFRNNRHEADGWRRRQLGNCLKADQHMSPHGGPARTGSSLSKKSGSSDKTAGSSPGGPGQQRKNARQNAQSRPTTFFSKLASESTSAPVPSPASADKLQPKLKSQVKRLSAERTEQQKTESPAKASSGRNAAPPAPVLPSSSGDWTVQKSSTGKQYYYNKKTKVSQWTLPGELAVVNTSQGDTSDARAQDTGEPDRKKPVPTEETERKKHVPKRKAEEIVSPGTSVAAPKYPKITPRNESLLGSPISDDDNGMSLLKGCAVSSAQSVEMDISDGSESSASNHSKKAMASAHRGPSPSRSKVSNEKSGKTCAEISPSGKRTKAPTVDDLRKLNETLDPGNRRSDKLQRVEKWMKKIETVIDTVSSPPDDVSLSPVSSIASMESAGTSPSRHADSPVVTSTAFLKLESDSALPAVHCPSPLPAGGCSKIVLPTFDLCELPDLSKSDVPPEFNVTLTQIFRSLKIEATEDQRCKILLESLAQQHCRADEKTVVLKNNLADIRQTKIVTSSETDHINSLSKFEDELFRSIHSGPENKPADSPLKTVVKVESVEMDIKEENSNDSTLKRVLATPDVFPSKGLEMSA